MKVKRFKIPIYDYRVTLIEVTDKSDTVDLDKLLIRETINKEDVDELLDEVKNGKYAGGYTYRNLKRKRFIIILFPCPTEKERMNILCHEKRHVEDRLAEHSAIEGVEAMAYLAGFLGEKLLT